LSDVSAGAKIRPARGQIQYGVQGHTLGGGVVDDTILLLLARLKVTVRDSHTDQTLSGARTQVYSTQTDQLVATSSTGTYALPAGTYRIVASAPSYARAEQEVSLIASHSLDVTISVTRLTAWQQFLAGMKSVFVPQPP